MNQTTISMNSKFESCVICLEERDVGRFFSVDGCNHRYCFSCMKQQVKANLQRGMVPKCPHEGCNLELKIPSCEKFLPPELLDIMTELIKEASIPVTQKIYCPYPKCSALMSKSALVCDDSCGAAVCTKCRGHFCINCKVPWHSNITCSEYKESNPVPIVEDAKLKNLAATNQWRQCVKCNHMIEFAAGCFHMTCRCGYEFCYKCGAEWKDKKATCSCPLWDEQYIIYA